MAQIDGVFDRQNEPQDWTPVVMLMVMWRRCYLANNRNHCICLTSSYCNNYCVETAVCHNLVFKNIDIVDLPATIYFIYRVRVPRRSVEVAIDTKVLIIHRSNSVLRCEINCSSVAFFLRRFRPWSKIDIVVNNEPAIVGSHLPSTTSERTAMESNEIENSFDQQ